MKIVIEIPKETWERIKDGYVPLGISKYLSNGTSLDKIKSEIERQEKWLLQAGCNTYNVDIAFDAIKSAVAESGGEK